MAKCVDFQLVSWILVVNVLNQIGVCNEILLVVINAFWSRDANVEVFLLCRTRKHVSNFKNVTVNCVTFSYFLRSSHKLTKYLFQASSASSGERSAKVEATMRITKKMALFIFIPFARFSCFLSTRSMKTKVLSPASGHLYTSFVALETLLSLIVRS